MGLGTDLIHLFFILLSVLTFIMMLILIIYLTKKRNTFPYSNISPIWTIALLVFMALHSIITLVIYFLEIEHEYHKDKLPGKNWHLNNFKDPEQDDYKHTLVFYVLNLFKSLYIHYIMVLPILARFVKNFNYFRFYYVSQSIKYNYHHLSKKIQDFVDHKKENTSFLRKKQISENKFYNYSKVSK